MATHSSILAWARTWTEEPGRLQSVGSRKSHTGLRTKQQNGQSRKNRQILRKVQPSKAVCVCVCVCVCVRHSVMSNSATPWTVAS